MPPYLNRLFFVFLISTQLCSCSFKTSLKDIVDYQALKFSASQPFLVKAKLSRRQIMALAEDRLMLSVETGTQSIYLSVQDLGEEEAFHTLLIDSVPLALLDNNARWHIAEKAQKPIVLADMHPENGQIIISEDEKVILHYNYLQIFEKDVYRSEREKQSIKDKDELEAMRLKNQRYAVPRSNYIHPLFDLNGEMLTRDWPYDHPHHRGIYWAWPEVSYKNHLADLHALQEIYARPNGNFDFTSGPLFAEINAENLWYWQDEKPLVHERAIIRVHKKRSRYRIVDLELTFVALTDSISIATRNQNSYGGLNIRMPEPKAQCIHYFMGEEVDQPLRAWSVLHGFFGEHTDDTSGLVILQSRKNPDYPGAWVVYPELSWVQPTFPANGTRFALSVQSPLQLHYRMIIYSGEMPDENFLNDVWDGFNL